MLLTALLAVLVFVSAFAGEAVQVSNIRSIASGRNPHVIARTSVLEWSIGAVGWLIVVRTQELGYLAPEVVGLYFGSWYAARRSLVRPQP